MFLTGDNPDPLASEDSHNFGPVPQSSVEARWVNEESGPDGVRTRDRRIKSPSLYLTKLQAHLGLLPRLFNASCKTVLKTGSILLGENGDTIAGRHHDHVAHVGKQADLNHTR